jgi:outer membrane protein assembly factor BamE (lipoprotein component of BamABCDE complex)
MAIGRKLLSILVAVAIATATIGCGNSSSSGVDANKSGAGSQNNAEPAKQVPAGLTPKQQQVMKASKGKDDD